MKAYSEDLRQRVVDAVDAGVPRPEVARLFQVSLATVKRYLKQRREAGHLRPGRSPGRTPGIAAAQHPALAAQVAAHPDDTLEQHCARWRVEQGDAPSVWAMQRALARAKITRKKSR
jgi:transposase